MAKLSFIEKDCFERLFGMENGYVLDFTNRTFQEFFESVMHIEIYSKYPNLSKAKMLRNVIYDYDDITVGKILLELMTYMQSRNMNKDVGLFEQCSKIGHRLIGKKDIIKKESHKEPQQQKKVDFDRGLEELKHLTDFQDTPQARGFAFEKYLRSLFESNGLKPRGSFKVTGEQIDGSFLLHDEVYLLEAKWTNAVINKSDLVIFNEKVSSKSGFTRGLYISFSGYSEDAVTTFANGRTVNIVLMTVQELVVLLTRKIDLTKALDYKVRALAETGNFNKTILEI